MSETLTFLKQKFSEYYRENTENIHAPKSLEKREFGFFVFKENIMVRHKSFMSEHKLKDFLAASTPSDIYYSSAYYETPEAPMSKKRVLGADLIFDIDSDHLARKCKNEHDYWTCRSCKNARIGKHPAFCPRCNGDSFKKETWLCEICLESAKAETIKLVEFLTSDFSFPQEDIKLCFSGQRGYHVSVDKDDIKQLDQAARKEIVDYISGTGLRIEQYGWRTMGHGKSRELIGPDLSDRIRKSKAEIIVKNKDFMLKNWNRKTNWRTIKNIDEKTFEKIIQHVIKNNRVTAVIDTVVTTDMHRLIRLPCSLHGKTGLMATEIEVNNLENFDPFMDAIAFKRGKIECYIKEAHQFRIEDKDFGPYTRENVMLPMAAAVFLMCKNLAKPKGNITLE